MGASAIPQSVDFWAFETNVKTIAPKQKLYQFGHAIWLERAGINFRLFVILRDIRLDEKSANPYIVKKSGIMYTDKEQETIACGEDVI